MIAESGRLAEAEVDGRQLVALVDLVLDPALQMRVKTDDDRAQEYADAVKAGATLPPIQVFRVDGELLVTDGWHRVRAAELGEYEEIEALVKTGNRREAFAAAVGANATHGLQRSTEDKRRAVAAVLMDAEWCQLSSRKAAAIVRVTHTYIGNERKRYGVKKGERLTEGRLEQVDGAPPPAWQRLLDKAPSYYHGEIKRVRMAGDLEQLDKASVQEGEHSMVPAAVEQRLGELAVQPWPWPEYETPAQRAELVAQMDQVSDIETALLAKGCPDRGQLWQVWLRARMVDEMSYIHTVERALQVFAGRPGLEDLARKRLETIQAEEVARLATPSKYNLSNAICDMEPAEQAAEIEAAAEEVIGCLRVGDISDQGRAALRARRAETTEVADCPDPTCGGWGEPVSYRQGLLCCQCRRTPTEVQERITRVLQDAADLIRAGESLKVGRAEYNFEAFMLLTETLKEDSTTGEIWARVRTYRASVKP